MSDVTREEFDELAKTVDGIMDIIDIHQTTIDSLIRAINMLSDIVSTKND